MKNLKFEQKEKREVAVTLRLKPSTVVKLKALARAYGVSQADVVERLIESTRAKK